MLVLLAVIQLLIGLSIGYYLFVRPREARIDAQGKLYLLFCILTLCGAAFGALPWWFDNREAFAWNLPPLASRMLGAAAFSFVVGGVLVLLRPTQEKTRLLMLMNFVYLIPLVAAIVLFHLDRFEFDSAVVWGFFPLAVVMCSATTYFLVKSPYTGEDLGPERDLSPLLKGWLAAVALVTALWGLALFITDNGSSALVWAWPGDLLSSRLIGVMLLTVAACCVYSIAKPRTLGITLAVCATYGLAGAAANIANELYSRPVKESYVVVLGVIGVVSLGLLLSAVANKQSVTSAV